MGELVTKADLLGIKADLLAIRADLRLTLRLGVMLAAGLATLAAIVKL